MLKFQASAMKLLGKPRKKFSMDRDRQTHNDPTLHSKYDHMNIHVQNNKQNLDLLKHFFIFVTQVSTTRPGVMVYYAMNIYTTSTPDTLHRTEMQYRK